MHHKPSKINGLLVALATYLYQLAEKRKNKRGIGQTILKLLLELAGFVWLTVAGFQLNSVTGCFFAAVSCFAMAWHLDQSSATANASP